MVSAIGLYFYTELEIISYSYCENVHLQPKYVVKTPKMSK